MFRRTFVAAFVSLTAVGAGTLATATTALAGNPSEARNDQSFGLPAVLGGLPRTEIERGPTMTTLVHAGPGALAQIMVSGTRAVADGAGGMAPTLRQLHDAMSDVARRQNATLNVVGENRAYRVGSDGHEWSWLGNVYDYRSPRGTTSRRLVLATGHMNRVVLVTLEMAADRDVDLRPLMDGLSTILASTRGAPAAPAASATRIKV